MISVVLQKVGAIKEEPDVGAVRHRHQFVIDRVAGGYRRELGGNFTGEIWPQIHEIFVQNPRPDHIDAVHVGPRRPCPEQLLPQSQFFAGGLRRRKQLDSDACFPSELLQLLLARVAECLVRPLLEESQRNRFMNRRPNATFQ